MAEGPSVDSSAVVADCKARFAASMVPLRLAVRECPQPLVQTLEIDRKPISADFRNLLEGAA